MRKLLFLLPLLAVLFTTSCTTEEVDPDLAAEVAGTYTIDEWNVNGDVSSGSVLNVHKIVVTRENDNTVSVTLDFDGIYQDFTDSDLTVTESSTGYTISGTYSNGSITGTVVGNSITYTRDITTEYFQAKGDK